MPMTLTMLFSITYNGASFHFVSRVITLFNHPFALIQISSLCQWEGRKLHLFCSIVKKSKMDGYGRWLGKQTKQSNSLQLKEHTDFFKLQILFSILLFIRLNTWSCWWYKILLVSTNSQTTTTHGLHEDWLWPVTHSWCRQMKCYERERCRSLGLNIEVKIKMRLESLDGWGGGLNHTGRQIEAIINFAKFLSLTLYLPSTKEADLFADVYREPRGDIANPSLRAQAEKPILSGFKCWLCHLLTGWHWTSYLTSHFVSSFIKGG